MPVGRPVATIELTAEERSKLEALARRRKTSQAMALRCRIIPDCAGGLTNSEVAAKHFVALPTVGKWRSRIVKERLHGLADAPRPGPPRTITDAKVEKVITRALESSPAHATPWSTRSMAKASGLTQNAVQRIWKAFGLKPHLQETFKLSTDPFFVEKVRDVVGLYVNPPEQSRALVLCIDEPTEGR